MGPDSCRDRHSVATEGRGELCAALPRARMAAASPQPGEQRDTFCQTPSTGCAQLSKGLWYGFLPYFFLFYELNEDTQGKACRGNGNHGIKGGKIKKELLRGRSCCSGVAAHSCPAPVSRAASFHFLLCFLGKSADSFVIPSSQITPAPLPCLACHFLPEGLCQSVLVALPA